MMENREKTKVVVIGGGHGQSVILQGLKNVEDISLSTIVTVADDGGSTGRLRRSMNLPGMGDVRNVMVALSDEAELMCRLMDYRFEGDEEDVGGHPLGNLMLSALTEDSGNFLSAISELSRILRVKGKVIPSTTQVVTLCARMDDDTIVRGESNIPLNDNRIEEVFYQEDVSATKEAIEAVNEANYLIFGIGSLYTSILPNVIIPDLRQAILDSKAKRIYLCNVMTQHGETDNYSLEDHVEAIEKHLKGRLDVVISCSDQMPKELLKKYAQQRSYPVMVRDPSHHFELRRCELLTYENDWLKHDPEKIARVLTDLFKGE